MLRNFSIIFLVLFTSFIFAQEGTRPLSSNLNYIYKNLHPQSTKESQGNSNQKPAAAASFTLPFFEDFYYAPTNFYPDSNKWQDSSVYVNSGMATAPPSIGVATFDGLDKHGYPYDATLANLTLSKPADVLTSKPINLFTNGSLTLTPSADIALSFYYQARGKGDNPELSDSLIVDFYRPLAKPDSALKPDTAWKKVWFTRGNASSNTNDSVFKRAFIRIQDTAYFHDGFQFRFRNWASPTGNFDHWHIDYILLDKGRGDSLFDTIRNDITFGDVPTPFLKDYSEMPRQQYDVSEMAEKINVKIRNNSGSQLNMSYKYKVYDLNNVPIFSDYDGGFQNLNPFWKNTFLPAHYGYSNFPPHANPNVKDAFVLTPGISTRFPIKHYVFLNSSSVSSDVNKENDTLIQYQYFRNFYAFDDGSAEAGYYIATTGGKMAVKIKLNNADSLLGLRIYFDPIGNVSAISNTFSSIYTFTINVWKQESNGEPSILPIIKDSINHIPSYSKQGFKEIPEFRLKHPAVLGPGTYFIGIQQSSSQITVGLDRNYNHKNSLYYDSGSGWKQSEEDGSLMMQPVFGTYLPIVGIPERVAIEKNKFSVYPNPASEQFTILSTTLENTSYLLFNPLGQLVKEEKLELNAHVVSTTQLNQGIYILILKNNGQAVQQQKIIVQH